MLASSRETLGEYGNMSAASVLFVLDAWLKHGNILHSGARGLMLAFGPGISTEALLLAWR